MGLCSKHFCIEETTARMPSFCRSGDQDEVEFIMKLKSPFLIQPHTSVNLAKISSSSTHGYSEKEADSALDKFRDQLSNLQEVFYASQAKALLIVLQGMDTAGKDGTIRHIFSGINPQLRRVQLQGADAARGPSRLSMAMPGRCAAARHDRHLQPLAL
jgi:hypothetical protein